MKILVVSQYFFPENFRINQLCLDLKELGHEITVLTGKPNYPQGEYFEGYSYKGNEDELWNDIPIYRVPLRARHKGAINLVRNYFSFVFQANKRIKKLEEKYDLVYVFEVSPMTVALPAIKYKKIHSVPVIMNVQDLWPENIIAVTGINNSIVNYFLNRLVNYIYQNCDLLLCASPSFVEKIQARVIDKEKVKYWPQYASITKVGESLNFLPNNKFNITFTGNIGEAQGIDLAIEAANQLKETPIHWNFVGNGRNKEKLEKMVNDYHLENNVTFHGFVEEEKVPYYLNESDAALLILKPNPVFEMTIPAKLQTYLACGVPIIGCVSGEGKRIILEANCGVVSEDISVEALVKVCKIMIESPKDDINSFRNNSLKFGENNFNKKLLINKLNKYMEDIIK